MTAAREDSRTAGPGSAWVGPAWSDAAPSPRILLIDDEPQISGFVGRALERAGYQAEVASDAASGVRSAAGGGYDLVILDLIMPDMDGRTALAAILRAHPAQAVLVLSCNSDPCHQGGVPGPRRQGLPDQAVLPGRADRAGQGQAARERPLRSEVMQVGDLTLDAGRLVADSGTGPVALTRLEFLCLRALMEHGHDSVTKSELLASVWGIEFDPGSNIVDVCIRRLRVKLGFALIETVRGEGYRLAS